jgi:hypothetical protein
LQDLAVDLPFQGGMLHGVQLVQHAALPLCQPR